MLSPETIAAIKDAVADAPDPTPDQLTVIRHALTITAPVVPDDSTV